MNALALSICKIAFFKLIRLDGMHARLLMQWVYDNLLTIFCPMLLWSEDSANKRFIS